MSTAVGTWCGDGIPDRSDIVFVQVIVNSQGSWSRDIKDRLAASVTDTFRTVLADDAGEISIWFEEYGALDVFVGAVPVAVEPSQGG